MTQATNAGLDLYVRITDASGRATTRALRVWDKDRKLQSLADEASKENAEQKGGAPRKASVQQLTEQQYLDARGAR